ncbi:hypothetical protein V2G26_005718 [Clonostachys chloroleuca]
MTAASATLASTTMATGGHISGTISTTKPTAISCANSTDANTLDTCPKDNSVVIGGAVGGALGTLLLGSLGTIVLLLLRRTKAEPTTPGPSISESPKSEPQTSSPPSSWAVYELPQAKPSRSELNE